MQKFLMSFSIRMSIFGILAGMQLCRNENGLTIFCMPENVPGKLLPISQLSDPVGVSWWIYCPLFHCLSPNSFCMFDYFIPPVFRSLLSPAHKFHSNILQLTCFSIYSSLHDFCWTLAVTFACLVIKLDMFD